MANKEQDNEQQQQRPEGTQNTFHGGMYKDLTYYLQNPNTWFSAKNMVAETQVGDMGVLSTESANQFCVAFPYQIIGAIPLDGNQWMTFHTDNIHSEIGITDTDNCTYTKFSNTPCLNFNTSNLITGAARRNFDCGFNVYWSDGARNPDRYVNTNPTDVNNNIWIQNCTTVGTCTTCVNTDVLNCDNIRIAPLMTIPCLSLEKANSGGTLLNGTYQVALAYAVNSIKCTDYVIISNPVSLFSHSDSAGAVKLRIQNADLVHFKEMIITVISYIGGQLVAKKLGIFDTTESTIYIDFIDPTLPNEDISNIPLQVPALEKSDSIWNVNTYLLRNGVYEKPDFNYQPLANKIHAKFVCVEYEEQYYKRGGVNTSYLRDEIYAFFIRWVYNTGDKSASYHIPGRAFNAGTDSLWATTNTASITNLGGGFTSDGGTIVCSGDMSYWQSTELYPDHQTNVWGSLCGTPIRHHKMPDQTISNYLTHFTSNNTIRILGVEFENIALPVDINGSIITNIVGYEILRGSREGNKSILAKGMFNNMRGYQEQGSTTQGLYQNYPYNDLGADRYLTTLKIIGTKGGLIDGWQGNELTDFKNNYFSFHSPDTTFSNPFLGSGTIRMYQSIWGMSQGSFHQPYHHPKFKLASNLASTFAIAIGAISVLMQSINVASGGATNISLPGTPDLPITIPLGLSAYPDGSAGALGDATYIAMVILSAAIFTALIPIQLKAVQAQMMNVVNGLIPAKQYAYQYDSHGYYNQFNRMTSDFNVGTSNYEYIKGNIQSFDTFEVNNLFRNDYVLVKTDFNLPTPDTYAFAGSCQVFDRSRFTLGNPAVTYSDPCNFALPVDPFKFGPFNTPIVSYYGGYKVSIPSQYGQVWSIREIPISGCVYTATSLGPIPHASPLLFGGDTYINRYTEKNPFLFFNDWLGVDGQKLADDFHYDYTTYENVPYPRYWINNTKMYYDFWATASDNYHLDEGGSAGPAGSFYMHDGFFYLFCNGVRDFYVESDVNVGYRDWGEEPSKRFYDPYGYTSTDYMFRSDYIKNPVYYKYDYSLSVNKFYTQYISFGQTLDREYDPTLAYTCYDYYPRRVAYSLPQTEELKIDNWRQFLPNNFYDFYTPVTAIKPTNKTGAIFLMKEQSPVKFEGVQILQNGEPGKIAITVGDGGLFNQPLQNVINIDKGLNYGNCTSRYSIINTPHGTYYVSQQAGKIFGYAEQYKQHPYAVTPLEEISAQGLKYWFAKYLPSQLLEQFPNYPYSDNPVIGVGVICSYDETFEILYITKRDYKVKDEFIGKVFFNGARFYYSDVLTETDYFIDLTNELYFDDCSWTVSYSPKMKAWISYHSWLPDWMLSARKHNYTVKNNSLWLHNVSTSLFSNYYEQDYPTNIDYIVNTPIDNITTLRNVEWYLDGWQYKANGWDKFLQYDSHFDSLIVYNAEQVSGLLKLNPQPTNPYDSTIYPIITPSNIQVLYSMKERKFRVNSIVDITLDRGEYSPTLTQNIITEPNGVDYIINNLSIDYFKPDFQRKKFRSEANHIFLQKNLVGNTRLSFYLGKTKNQISSR